MFDASREALVVLDSNGVILQWNSAFVKVFNIEIASPAFSPPLSGMTEIEIDVCMSGFMVRIYSNYIHIGTSPYNQQIYP